MDRELALELLEAAEKIYRAIHEQAEELEAVSFDFMDFQYEWFLRDLWHEAYYWSFANLAVADFQKLTGISDDVMKIVRDQLDIYVFDWPQKEKEGYGAVFFLFMNPQLCFPFFSEEQKQEAAVGIIRANMLNPYTVKGEDYDDEHLEYWCKPYLNQSKAAQW